MDYEKIMGKSSNMAQSLCIIVLIILLVSAVIICYKILKEKTQKNMIRNQSDIDYVNCDNFDNRIDDAENLLEIGGVFVDIVTDKLESKVREWEYNKETMKANFIDNMIDIENEPILYRFKENTNTIKEVLVGFPIIAVWILMTFLLLIEFILFVYLDEDEILSIILYCIIHYGIILFVIIGGIYFIVKTFDRIRSKDTKNHYSWAISENYFIQVLYGMVDVGFHKKDIIRIENTGYEIILELSVKNPRNLNGKGNEYKIIMEDVEDIDDVFDILRDWLG